MAIEVCGKCGAKNRVDERVTFVGRRPVCGRCGASLAGEGDARASVPHDEARGGGRANTRPAQPGTGGGPAAGETNRPQDVTDATFASEVLARSSEVPVLLDCWAAWCAPCRMVAPVLDQLAAESGGRYRVAKLNVDHNKQTAARLAIQSIPTLFIFKDGEPVERIVGAQPKHVLAARLAAHA
jgi:thioredoxin